MDLLGNVVRNLMQTARARTVKSATALALGFSQDGMDRDQIEEMLFDGGYETDVIDEVMGSIPTRN